MANYSPELEILMYRVSHMYLNNFKMPLGDSGVMVLQFCKQIVNNTYFEHSFVEMNFQCLKHGLQRRMVYHRNQLLEAAIKLWQTGYPYSRIVDTINDSVIAQISKGTVAYQVKKFQETNSVKSIKIMDGLDMWGCLICQDQQK